MTTIPHFFGNKKVLIAGGLGFIGSNLARKLLQLGAQVQIIDSLLPEGGGNLFNISGIEHRLDVQIADVRNEAEIRSLVEGKDFLFNLVAQTSHSDSMRDPYGDLELNGRAQLAILEACKNSNLAPKIIFTSTRQVYGKTTALPVSEHHPICPLDINGIHKYSAERYHQIYNQVHGLRVSILRLTNTYGPRMRIQDSRQTFLGHWIHEILTGNEFEIFGNGRQLRDFTFVDDAVDALLLAAERPEADGQVFNVGTEMPSSLESTAKILIDLNGRGSYRFVPFPKALEAIDIGSYYSDISKIRSLLGWQPKIALKDGLKKTLQFFSNHFSYYQTEQKINAVS